MISTSLEEYFKDRKEKKKKSTLENTLNMQLGVEVFTE